MTSAIHTGPFRRVLAFLLGTALSASACQAGQPELPETAGSEMGYETVAAALAGVHSDRDVVFTTENGWLIATNESAYTIWSFAPKGYAAYPAVVKRQVVSTGGGSNIQMSVLCEASKKACDDLVRTFSTMNGFTLPQ